MENIVETIEGVSLLKFSTNQPFIDLRNEIESLLKSEFDIEDNISLDKLHNHLDTNTLNEKRLECIKQINEKDEFSNSLAEIVEENVIEALGPDLLMQNRLNLTIHIPNDPFSILPLHSDCWDGESPFELNCWVPLTKTFGTNSMLILPAGISRIACQEFSQTRVPNISLADKYETDIVYLETVPGDVVLFSPTLLHGNVVNLTDFTRVSINVRFKNLFSPVPNPNKGLGTFYRVLKKTKHTQMGLDYLLDNNEP